MPHTALRRALLFYAHTQGLPCVAIFSDKSATLFRPGRKGVFLLHNEKEKAEWAITQLREKAEEIGRVPQKADFDEVTRSRIKAFLGPWPRALEKAGLKEKKL